MPAPSLEKVASSVEALEGRHSVHEVEQAEQRAMLLQHARLLQALQQQVSELLERQDSGTLPTNSKGKVKACSGDLEPAAGDIAPDATPAKLEVNGACHVPSPPAAHTAVTECVVTECAVPVHPKMSAGEYAACIVTTEEELMEATILGEDPYAERRSCWDAVVFLGHTDALSWSESTWVLGLVVLTICMQVGFVGVIYTSLTMPQVDDEEIENFRMWRLDSAHRYDLVDSLRMESLASRVCREDASLHVSLKQSETVSLINAYLYDNVPFNGPLMCSLAMASWLLVVLREVQVVLDRVRLLFHVPRGATSFKLGESEIRLAALHPCRAMWYYFILCLRTFIVTTLLFAGMKFLAFTIELPELILNAVALEFILMLDEMVLMSLGPFRTRAFIRALKPMKLPARWMWNGIDFQVIFGAIVMVLCLGFGIGVKLMENMDYLVRAHDAICGGQLNWAYGVTAAGFPVWSELRDSSGLDHTASVQYRVLNSLAQAPLSLEHSPTEAEAFKLFAYSGASWSLTSMTSWSVREMGQQLNNNCEDQLTESGAASADVTYAFHLASVQDGLRNYSIRYCSDVAHLCQDGTTLGVYVRLACPVSCGCRSPSSELVLAAPEFGCGSPCISHPDYVAEKQNLSCVERSFDDPDERSKWEAMANRTEAVTVTWPTSTKSIFAQLATFMRTGGCAAIQQAIDVYKWNLCAAVGALKSLAVDCPVSCGCTGGTALVQGDECPGTCPR